MLASCTDDVHPLHMSLLLHGGEVRTTMPCSSVGHAAHHQQLAVRCGRCGVPCVPWQPSLQFDDHRRAVRNHGHALNFLPQFGKWRLNDHHLPCVASPDRAPTSTFPRGSSSSPARASTGVALNRWVSSAPLCPPGELPLLPLQSGHRACDAVRRAWLCS